MFTRLYLITRNSEHTVSQPLSLESPAKVKLKKIKHAEVIGPVPEGTGVHLMFLSPCSSSSRCRGRRRRRRSRAHDAIHGNSIHLMRQRRDNERRAKVVHDSTCPQQRRRSEIEMPRGLVSGAILPVLTGPPTAEAMSGTAMPLVDDRRQDVSKTGRGTTSNQW